MKENSREPTKIIIIACACGIMKIRRKRESCDDYTTTTACWANTTPDHCPSPRDVSSTRARSRGARPALKYIKACVGVRKVHSKNLSPLAVRACVYTLVSKTTSLARGKKRAVYLNCSGGG